MGRRLKSIPVLSEGHTRVRKLLTGEEGVVLDNLSVQITVEFEDGMEFLMKSDYLAKDDDGWEVID